MIHSDSGRLKFAWPREFRGEHSPDLPRLRAPQARLRDSPGAKYTRRAPPSSWHMLVPERRDRWPGHASSEDVYEQGTGCWASGVHGTKCEAVMSSNGSAFASLRGTARPTSCSSNSLQRLTESHLTKDLALHYGKIFDSIRKPPPPSQIFRNCIGQVIIQLHSDGAQPLSLVTPFVERESPGQVKMSYPDVIEDVKQQLNTNYMGFASFSMLVWDHIDTFADEVEYIWLAKKKGPIGWLFLVNRYLTPLGFCVNLIAYHGTFWTPEQFMMYLRIHALYHGNYWVLGSVLAIFATQLGVNAWLMTHAQQALGVYHNPESGIRACTMIFDPKLEHDCGGFGVATTSL
ncbi:hypothetical protein NMY22_g7635 [Coprinellus aureogranulatus]|nr:hypothetical protein NMY22_g7635 [Coprinellus aureogranulatus]